MGGVDDVANGIAERIEDGDKVNYIGLREGIDLVTEISSTVLGYLTIIILMLVPIIITAEIIYICFPIVRNPVDKLLVNIEGKGILHTTVGVCLRDAIEAVEQSEIDGVGSRSALWIYLKLKCKSMEILMFVIALVVQGSPVIFNAIWKGASGLLTALINMFNTVVS